MDQAVFRETYRDVNERACVFERAILTHQCGCSRAERFCIAEREGVACNLQEGYEHCTAFIAVLREKARFALRDTAAEGKDALPYGKAMRVQVGGLRGLQAPLAPASASPGSVRDVYDLIRSAIATYGKMDAVPFADIMPYIAAYRGRTRSRRRRED